MNIYIPKKPIDIKNIEGTSLDARPPQGSWINFFREYGYSQRTCAVGGCVSTTLIGGHVKVRGKRGEWIVPICQSCNSYHNTEWMRTNRRVVCVPVDWAYE